MSRPLHVIAREIRREWKSPHFAAVPYLDAMGELDRIDDRYYSDTARTVVLYFLSNAGTWRGPIARQIKAELKELLK